MKIVTGYTGTPHVSSNDDQGFHQGIFGAGNNILNVGSKFAAELIDATTITIGDGEGMLQGVHFRVAPGTVDTVNIDAGVVGYNRIDLICARYTKDANSGVESVDWYVVKGTPSASTPTAPDAEDGDVLAGDLVADFPMYKVTDVLTVDLVADFPMYKVTLTGVTPALTDLVELATGDTKQYEKTLTYPGSSGGVLPVQRLEVTVDPGIYYVEAQVALDRTSQAASIDAGLRTQESLIPFGDMKDVLTANMSGIAVFYEGDSQKIICSFTAHTTSQSATSTIKMRVTKIS